ncbi:MAG: slipin family protein [Clostridia bacterium]|nr:slipin family protein [Clostridia bacterium]
MFKKIIKNDERGLLFKDGNYIKCLKPGKYYFNPFVDYKIIPLNINESFNVRKDINLFLQDENLLKELILVDVKDSEIVLHYEDGNFKEVLPAGKYAYWNILKKHNFISIDINDPEVNPKIDISIFNNPELNGYYSVYEVAGYETGVLYYNNVMQKILEPGRYYFWEGPTSVNITIIDLRQHQIDMTGQEIMTEDKVSLRLNFVCHYKIVNPLKVIEINGYHEQVYILLQLILREYVGSLKLDELLKIKEEIGNFVLSRLKEKSEDFGIQFLFAGVKDVILPGDVKEILNTVLLAEKKAQANLITRREEIASTRSLLNTAKLMDENQTLYRLKELEFLEKICDKIGNISLLGGGNLLEQLNSLLAGKDTTKLNQ